MSDRPTGMRTGLTISCAGHAAVLVLSVLTFVARPHPVESTEAVPIDIVSNSQFAQMTGAKVAPPVEKPKPVVEKVADPTPVEDLTPKLAKREIKATSEVPPVPEVKPPEPKAKKQASPPPQPTQPPVDQIADLMKKDDAKPVPKKPDPKPPAPPKKPVQQQEARAFVPNQIQTLLQDKQDPQRTALATDKEMNRTPSMTDAAGGGRPTSGANNPNGLTDIEKGELRAKLKYYWNPPPSLMENKDISLEVVFHLNPDGTLDGSPEVLTQGDGPVFVAASDAAKRAVRQAQPYTMFRPEHYDAWRNLDVVFDPKTMGY